MSQPPEVPDVGPPKEEVEEIVEQAVGGVDFGEAFMNDLLLFFYEEAAEFLFSGQTTYLILGSYERYRIRKLHMAESQLNQRPFCYAYLLCDLLDAEDIRDGDSAESDTNERGPEGEGSRSSFADHEPMDRCKFCLLAPYSDHLVLIFEGRHVGPSIELEIIHRDYHEKGHLFPRTYETLEVGEVRGGYDGSEGESGEIDISNPYSNTQRDLFGIFARQGRVYEWETRGELAAEIGGLP